MTDRKAPAATAGLCVLGAVLCGVSLAASSDGDVVSKYDTDNDKTLDLAEVKAAASAHFDKLNKDGDGTLENQEVKGLIGPSAFKAADTDHDGTLSKDEYLALVEKLSTGRCESRRNAERDRTEIKERAGARASYRLEEILRCLSL
jgi:hypothetical protein